MDVTLPNGAILDTTSAAAGIRVAMQIGTPADPAARPVFILPVDPTGTGLDERGVPFDPSQAMSAQTTELTGVLCAYDAIILRNDDVEKTTGVATQQVRITVTLLDTEYQQVKECIAVRIGGSTYWRWRDNLPYAIGAMGVWQIMFRAGDVN